MNNRAPNPVADPDAHQAATNDVLDRDRRRRNESGKRDDPKVFALAGLGELFEPHMNRSTSLGRAAAGGRRVVELLRAT